MVVRVSRRWEGEGEGGDVPLTDSKESAGETRGVQAGPADGARASFLTRYVFKCMWEDCGDR